jgi:hypothetical protein
MEENITVGCGKKNTSYEFYLLKSLFSWIVFFGGHTGGRTVQGKLVQEQSNGDVWLL